MYKNRDNVIYYQHANGETYDAAVCNSPNDAIVAVVNLNKSVKLNDKRQYTNSARAMRQAEMVSGFKWLPYTGYA